VPGTEWRKPPLQIGQGSVVEAALWKHVGVAMGAACKDGPADLDAPRGSLLRVGWRTTSGVRATMFTIDQVRGEVTLWGALHARRADPPRLGTRPLLTAERLG
jgi:hypothetical protein